MKIINKLIQVYKAKEKELIYRKNTLEGSITKIEKDIALLHNSRECAANANFDFLYTLHYIERIKSQISLKKLKITDLETILSKINDELLRNFQEQERCKVLKNIYSKRRKTEQDTQDRKTHDEIVSLKNSQFKKQK
ncbi:flagellar FliJ family protein [Candidatus Sneabacter namystus]|uniref:Flagellar FliJ protein n=1 Tax=Candidatus Sneabacter namystus TaxID=2601646 RepID=A0A5C0UHP2_9RICK|nr:flagellar FliJ family protein [Candidatus Sneabacter namystus]QEK39685.1 hypothetical protein FZC37_01935 [Candidatus Sneabacter namystus]